jgi:mevalonate kinase
MLMGEHSVVHGYPALVATLPMQIRIHWQARADRRLVIHSALAEYDQPLEALTPHPALRFVLAPLQHYANRLQHGWTLRIESDFPADWGLGSSAAVLAACISGLEHLLQQNWSIWQKFELGHQCILSIQGRGSGADLAACLVGGVVYFHPQQQRIERLTAPLELSLVYAGYKTPTAQVLAWVAQHWQTRPQALAKLYQKMGEITERAHQALCEHRHTELHQAFSDYQACLTQLGVTDATLERLLNEMRPLLPAAKISGSGLGDCLVGLGHLPACTFAAYLNSHTVACSASVEPVTQESIINE